MERAGRTFLSLRTWKQHAWVRIPRGEDEGDVARGSPGEIRGERPPRGKGTE